MQERNIAVLPGDGIGPEVIRQAIKVLRAVSEKFQQHFAFSEFPIGGAALKKFGEPLPPVTLARVLQSHAVLLGAVGAPEFDGNPPDLKPEKALLRLREKLNAFANLRPVRLYESLIDASPLKREIVQGTDILIVRELTGGLYFGEPRGCTSNEGFNTMRYTTEEIERIALVAFRAARGRRKILHSVDKANVLETSQLWRRTVISVSNEFPDVHLEHLYVDNCAMQLIAAPNQFDVILTENMFGDILSDEAAMLTGSIGMLPSASIGGSIGLYEPIHGSAPTIAGKNMANPLAAIVSAAMMLRHSFHLEKEAIAIENAIQTTLDRGFRTADIHRGKGTLVGTEEMGDQVATNL
jgi:3-isopropylmalate dehydrogenase